MKKYFSMAAMLLATLVMNAQTATSQSDEFECGDNVNVSATAQEHYHFVNWTSTDATRESELNNNSAFDQSTRVVTSYIEGLNADVDATANFAINQNKLIIDPANASMGDVYEADGTTASQYKTPGKDVDYGTSVTAVAVPETCYKFVEWEVTTGSDEFKAAIASQLTSASITFDMPDEAITLSAKFEKIKYTVTVSPNDDNMGTAATPTVRP